MRTAYVTVLCNGDSYLPGVEVLGRSIVESGSSVPRVVMTTRDVSASARAVLRAQGWQTRDIEPIANPSPPSNQMFSRFANVFTKLRAWELTELDRVAKARGLPHAQVALAWLLQKDPVTAPIVGATKMDHLEAAAGALAVQLSREDVASLEAPYVPHAIAGHS